jgi:hypothetical protein
MWLVLCSTSDLPALWAYYGLKARTRQRVELVTADMLAYSLSLTHRLKGDTTDTTITLSDGRVIDSATIGGVLNRLAELPSEHMRAARPEDRAYAQQEILALFLSWLYSIDAPVLNRATPRGLGGAWRPMSEWVWLANQAGLPTLPYSNSSSDDRNLAANEGFILPAGTPTHTILSVNGQTIGDAPDHIRSGCCRLADLADVALLGLSFVTNPQGSWTFAGATHMPDLRIGGEGLLNGLAAALGESNP